MGIVFQTPSTDLLVINLSPAKRPEEIQAFFICAGGGDVRTSLTFKQFIP